MCSHHHALACQLWGKPPRLGTPLKAFSFAAALRCFPTSVAYIRMHACPAQRQAILRRASSEGRLGFAPRPAAGAAARSVAALRAAGRPLSQPLRRLLHASLCFGHCLGHLCLGRLGGHLRLLGLLLGLLLLGLLLLGLLLLFPAQQGAELFHHFVRSISLQESKFGGSFLV